MLQLCLIASHRCPPAPGLVLHQEQGVSWVIKECPSSFPSKIMKPEMVRASPFDLKCNCNGVQGQPNTVPLHCEPKLIVDVHPKAQSPLFIDKPVTYLDPALFSFGIAEKCMSHEKFLKSFMFGLKDVDKGELDLSLLSNLIQPLMFGVHQQPYASLIYPNCELSAHKRLPDFVREMARDSKLMVNSGGQVVLPNSGTEIEDILSVVAAEFHLSSNSTKWRMKAGLVPYFYWKRSKKVHASTSLSQQFEVASVVPPNSPEKLKLKPLRKKKTSKTLTRDRNIIHTANYSHACESLLSLMVNRGRNGKTTILSLKKSGPELPQLLAQFSASIAGTGLAVLFSVICKVAYTGAPFCTSKIFSSSLGFGLVWLSWAVNRLRDTIVQMSKNGSKLGLKEKEMMKRVERSVDDIYFRAGTLMAIAMLKFA